MKLPFTIYDSRLPISKKSAATPIRHSSFVIRHSVATPRHPSPATRPSQQGMALVITLIMLSVTLIMAIAFLAISRRERISVSTSTDTTTARLASDTALAAAQGQILANILSTNSALYNYNLLVSTNYINESYGFQSGFASPTNVSYYYANGNLVAGSDFAQNVANLQILPRAPVMVSPTEPAGRFYLDLNRNGAFDDSGMVSNLDTYDINGNLLLDPNGNNNQISEIGDPQWVGVLERPGVPHAADNKFLSRYAFIALPVGESLDINAIHNETMTRTVQAFANQSGVSEGFMRNQGVGSWEINLASFLADLNTNQWNNPLTQPYQYFEPYGVNRGYAFDDALAFMGWRYSYNYLNLVPSYYVLVNNVLNYDARSVIPYDNIDEYSDGPLQLTTTNISEALVINQDNATLPWAGANNPNRFFTPDDYFDPTKSSGGAFGGFTNRLLNAGATVAANGLQPTYDRYTFYRMLDELGTDSLPDDSGKLNVNWQNAIVNYVNGSYVSATIVPGMETNLIPWNPRDFFCAAADHLLKTYTTNWFQANPSNFLATYYGLTNVQYVYTDPNGNFITNDPSGVGLVNYLGVPNVLGMTRDGVPAFGLTNIPVMVNGNLVYSPAVNRVLQLAANIFDASTNGFYPDVFRPTFLVFNQNGLRNVYINGYQQLQPVSGPNDLQLSQLKNLNFLNPGLSTVNYPNGVNVYGVPWIIGAKKFMPNFNAFYSYDTAQISRELQVTRTSSQVTYSRGSFNDFYTNQMFIMSITNHIGFSFWNSYAANYPGGTPTVVANDSVSMRLYQPSSGFQYSYNAAMPTFSPPMTFWPGSEWNIGANAGLSLANQTPYAGSFVSGTCDYPFVRAAALNLDQNGNLVGTGFATTNGFNTSVTAIYPFPQLELDLTNWFQGFVLDGTHVIDYVQFAGPSEVRNLGNDVSDPDWKSLAQGSLMWSTNASGAGATPTGVNYGVYNQMLVSETDQNVPTTMPWNSPGGMPSGLSQTPPIEAAFFKAFFTGQSVNGFPNTNLVQQAPYTPVRTVTTPVVWLANDPLVHYLSSDLNEPIPELNNGVWKYDGSGSANAPLQYPALTTVSQKLPLSERYQPWSQNSQLAGTTNVDKNAFNLAYKDPLVYGSDNWDFPANKYPTVGWLGRVHRGTPWQTVYLKSTNLLDYTQTDANGDVLPVGQTTWNFWTGDFNGVDAQNSRPVRDELLFDVFTAAPDPNATLGTLSVNQTHLAAWSAVLGGMNIISNATPGIPNYSASPVQTNISINPVGPSGSGAYSPLLQIINDIANTRANRNLFPFGAFTRVGDILRVPSLSVSSPFLLQTAANGQIDPNRVDYDISDEMYESIPQQLMGLVRPSGPPRFVIYSYGQTLKPAPDGTVLSGGAFFGLVTNYVIAAESAARAVVTVQQVVTNTVNGPSTNYTTKVENFSVLPPN